MPRARWLKPEFFRDRKIAELGPVAAIVFQALWVIADDGGMAPCDPDRLKGEMFFAWETVGTPEITAALRRLSQVGRVTFYQGGDELFCQIANWRHQRVHLPSAFRHRDYYRKQGKDFREVLPQWCGSTEEGDSQGSPPRLLDSKTPRLLESQKRLGASRRAEQDPPPEGTTPTAKAPRETWITPYYDDWVNAYGGEPNCGQLAKYLKPLHDKHGLEKTRAHWCNYLASTAADHVSPARFASTFGSWDHPHSNARPDSQAPRPNEDPDAYIARITGGAPRA